MATGGFLTAGSDPFVPQYTQEQLTVVVQTARRYHLPVTAHAHATGGIANAIAAGVDGVEHCSFHTPTGRSSTRRSSRPCSRKASGPA